VLAPFYKAASSEFPATLAASGWRPAINANGRVAGDLSEAGLRGVCDKWSVPRNQSRRKFRSTRPHRELNLAAGRNGRIVVLRLQKLESVPLHISGLLLVFSCVAAEAAALVAVPAPPIPPLPVMGLEPNNGQANFWDFVS